MVKRVLMLAMLLMLIFGTCYAEDEQVTKDLLDKYQNMQYSIEAGINKIDYDRQLRDIYIATKKADGKIKQDTYDKFNSALKSYRNAGDVWDSWRSGFRINDIKEYVDDINNFKKVITLNFAGQYPKDLVVSYVLDEANIKTKELTKLINEKPKEGK